MYSNKSIGIILSHVVILLFLTDEKAEVAVAILPHFLETRAKSDKESKFIQFIAVSYLLTYNRPIDCLY